MSKGVTHGLTRKSATPLQKKGYAAWVDILGRCHNENHSSYFAYGAKGIFINDLWRHDVSAFYSHVSELPNFTLEHSIDRIDNSRGYESGNLRWATKTEQCRNQGKSANNTSGKNGVTWYYNDTGGTRAIAWWQEGDKTKSKSFPLKKFGLLPSFKMACLHRDKMISLLNQSGAGYSENHGK